MHARSTTIEARLDRLDAGIAHVRDELMPQLLRVDGCVGMSMLLSRDTGRTVLTSAWQDLQAMYASEGAVRPLREQVAGLLDGPATVEQWQIAMLHRRHRTAAGACARVVRRRIDAEEVDRLTVLFRTVAAPAAEELDGFCSLSLLVSPETGQAASAVVFDGPQTLAASRERTAALREHLSREVGSRITDVSEYELALAHLHVPELV